VAVELALAVASALTEGDIVRTEDLKLRPVSSFTHPVLLIVLLLELISQELHVSVMCCYHIIHGWDLLGVEIGILKEDEVFKLIDLVPESLPAVVALRIKPRAISSRMTPHSAPSICCGTFRVYCSEQ
jgi:hypothetical protein